MFPKMIDLFMQTNSRDSPKTVLCQYREKHPEELTKLLTTTEEEYFMGALDPEEITQLLTTVNYSLKQS